MLIKLEIDLNYIDLHPSNIELFGWKIDDPLVVILEVNEVRLLNSIDSKELPTMGFSSMWNRKAINFSCSNQVSNSSYGCVDYLPKIFQTFVENLIDENNEEEEFKSP